MFTSPCCHGDFEHRTGATLPRAPHVIHLYPCVSWFPNLQPQLESHADNNSYGFLKRLLDLKFFVYLFIAAGEPTVKL